ncbi:hypothetical protein A9995_09640 [Erythrobacter sp. QSSC1-22B]|nr:hypothetical protein A9995_09640 [Erythrobacter sp. QSSC1-22B]
MHAQVFFTQYDLAKRWRLSPRTLEGWRLKGSRPSYAKIGNSVRYHIDEVEECERCWRSGEQLS